MREYIVRYQINMKTYEDRITAHNPTDAKKAVIAQYPGQKVMIINVKDTTTGWFG